MDLETIPRQDIPAPEFDESTVKLGNIKDPAKRDEKIFSERLKFDIGLVKKMSVTPELCQILSCDWTLYCPAEKKIIEEGFRYDAATDKYFIKDLVEEFTKHEYTLITWNGKGFDVPVLWKRSIFNKCGMNFIDYQRLTKKYDTLAHLDLMHAWNNYEMGAMSKCAEFLGIPCKTDFDGSMVYEAWQNGEHDKIKKYNEQDVDVMYQICKRIGIF